MSRTQNRSSQGSQETAVAVSSKERAAELQRSLEGRKDQMISLLGGDERLADRFLTVALSAIVKPGSGLLEADPLSIMNSVRDAAMMGLEPAGPLGEGAIVAYRDSDQGGKKIAQFQPMVRGLRKLALQHPDVSVVNVGIRHAKDEFEYREGSDPFIRHVPWIDDDDPGDVMGAYAYAKLRGETLVLYMNLAEIRKRQNVARTQKIWQAWPEEMMKKTVLRRLISEKLPMTLKLGYALSVEEADLSGKPVVSQDAVEGRVTVAAPGSRMRARLTAGDDVENAPESPQNGSGRPEGSEAESVSTPAETQASRAVCGAKGMKEGQVCDLDPHDASIPHESADGGVWG
jgi:phage RecT family recombinase